MMPSVRCFGTCRGALPEIRRSTPCSQPEYQLRLAGIQYLSNFIRYRRFAFDHRAGHAVRGSVARRFRGTECGSLRAPVILERGPVYFESTSPLS